MPPPPVAPTVALRWVLPFVRVTGVDPFDVGLFAREGLSPRDLANPDTRVSHVFTMELLTRAVERTGNAKLGLQAGEAVEAGDLDALEYAARSCVNLREAIHCANRYMLLMHGAQEAVLLEQGDRAIWQLNTTDDVPQHPAANDFALTTACWFARRYASRERVLREVHFRHEQPTDLAEYARIFDNAEIRMGQRTNALVFAREFLDVRMTLAHAGLQAAFEMHAGALLERLKRAGGVSGRVRSILVEQLRAGDFSMVTVSRKLAMSVATLRRRLSEENTSHSEILDDVRRELAEKYLADMSLAISEVAFLLGFSHVTAFYKAFRRWSHGVTPAEFRVQAQRR